MQRDPVTEAAFFALDDLAVEFGAVFDSDILAKAVEDEINGDLEIMNLLDAKTFAERGRAKAKVNRGANDDSVEVVTNATDQLDGVLRTRAGQCRRKAVERVFSASVTRVAGAYGFEVDSSDVRAAKKEARSFLPAEA